MGDDPEEAPELKPVSIAKNTDALRKAILSKKSAIANLRRKGFLSPSDDLFVLIKPDSNSDFKDLVDVFDEMAISGVRDYAKEDITENDRQLILRAGK